MIGKPWEAVLPMHTVYTNTTTKQQHNKYVCYTVTVSQRTNGYFQYHVNTVCSHSYVNTVCSHSYVNTVCNHSYVNTVCSHSYVNTVCSHSYVNTVCSHSYVNTVCSHSYVRITFADEHKRNKGLNSLHYKGCANSADGHVASCRPIQ